MGLFTDGKPLFQRLAFVLLGLLLRGRCQCLLVETFRLQASVLFQLLAITPVLDLPR